MSRQIPLTASPEDYVWSQTRESALAQNRGQSRIPMLEPQLFRYAKATPAP